ncbi:nucleoside deaminase [Diaphorobacter ruginosibacter]|jgi:tRNA(Arg) A34 adenosine deaminase TadA|uniref:Nucleoside deaminase n=1 Tax=Diaphorobacter ruginosibacter TaxID=1715720 RepID=A0A7G9RLY4_9BURK|nr:nucleoside deaminase [Diaphorobacter ruginosibacter]MDR2335802.1 nucleoside deaminase [Burkholderiaceae bacterium]QNN56609.1 nucleoside deaminase [Diaphorobacter ruginosibacter]
MSNTTDRNDTGKYVIESIRLAMGNVKGRKQATWPFGAVLVRDGKVLARAVNQVDDLCDPSAHAEMQAVRMAAKAQGSTDLSGAVVYASGYPCTMCYTAMLLAGVKTVYFAYSNEDGEPYDLSAARGYVELAKPEREREMALISHRVRDEGEDLYEAWQKAVSAT